MAYADMKAKKFCNLLYASLGTRKNGIIQYESEGLRNRGPLVKDLETKGPRPRGSNI